MGSEVTGSSVRGMDVEFADKAAHSMDGGVNAIHGVLSEVGSMLESTQWYGRYASDFLNDWHGTYSQELGKAGSMIDDHVAQLRRNIADQRAASDS